MRIERKRKRNLSFKNSRINLSCIYAYEEQRKCRLHSGVESEGPILPVHWRAQDIWVQRLIASWGCPLCNVSRAALKICLGADGSWKRLSAVPNCYVFIVALTCGPNSCTLFLQTTVKISYLARQYHSAR